MIEAYKKMMKNYAKFDGRTSRKDFWFAFLAYWLMSMIIAIPQYIVSFIAGFNAGYNGTTEVAANGALGILSIIFGIIVAIFELAHLVPLLAMEVRRLHDINKSGWFILLGLLSVCCGIGAIILIVFYCMPSVDEGNNYGEKV